MTTLELLGIILSSGVLVAIINQIGNYIFERRKRKDVVADKKDDTQDQLEELRTETSEQFIQVNSRIDTVAEKVSEVGRNTNLVMLSTKAQAYDRIRHLGLTYIKAGQISPEELDSLMEMHKAYKKLGGNGFLDKIMEEVNNLRIKID